MYRNILFLSTIVCIFSGAHSSSAIRNKKPIYKVKCSSTRMIVDIVYPQDATRIYLQHLKHFHQPKCEPKIVGQRATFSLNLKDIYECMMTQIMDKETGQKAYYHKIIMEYESNPKQIFMVKCDNGMFEPAGNSTSGTDELKVVKRSAQLPINFEEPDYEIEITSEVTGRAPVPVLNVDVRQNGLLIDDELTVKPGTPLSMDIYLDDESSDIYGLMVLNMRVSDMDEQEEILILNGCTVDPYLFENFLTENGDFLRARFKAFKFPRTNVVLFKGSVNVCLDKCSGVECANEEIGYGRRRRDVSSSKRNKIYEVSMSTIVKVSDGGDEDIREFYNIKKSRGSATPIGRPERPGLVVEKEEATLYEDVKLVGRPDNQELAIASLSEEYGPYKYVNFQGDFKSSASNVLSSALTMFIAIALSRS